MGLGGGGGCSPSRIFQIVIFGREKKNQVIFGQNHLIFVQAMEKYIPARDFSPPNETRPVRLWSWIEKEI